MNLYRVVARKDRSRQIWSVELDDGGYASRRLQDFGDREAAQTAARMLNDMLYYEMSRESAAPFHTTADPETAADRRQINLPGEFRATGGA